MKTSYNQYTQAVDIIQEYLDATNVIFEDKDLPGIESKLEFAMKILRAHQDYDGPNVHKVQ